jgi:membrane protein required for beta-lactamase induction
MRIIRDIWTLSLSRLMGVIAFALVVYCILTRQEIDYVSYSVYAMVIVWGVVFGKNFIGKSGAFPDRK